MQEHSKPAVEAATISRLQVEADEGSEQAQREGDEPRADLNESALNAIHAVINVQEWTPETPESIATILRAIGLPVSDVAEFEASSKR